MAKAKAKHHEPQALVKVEVIRGRVLRMMARDLAALRSFISQIDGNERVVESLRGKSGERILARCADFVMQELGDSSLVSKLNAAGVSRYIANKTRGLMGAAEGKGADGAEPQTA